ncbi:MAG: hypothetical protein J6T19_06945 [Paludibacteraceae bacterium]|nr:hypothetical protein [Paludibacteraceae bacterium]
MKKPQLLLRKVVLKATGKALALFGVIITFDGCFPVAYGPGPPPQPPQYWSDQEPEMTNPLNKNTENNLEYEQTPDISTQNGIEDRR